MKQDFAKAQNRDKKAGGHEKKQRGGDQELEASAKRLRAASGRTSKSSKRVQKGSAPKADEGLAGAERAAKAAKPETKTSDGTADDEARLR